MIGKTISHFKILEKLGEGGMGVVYKAEDTRLHRTVALKFISRAMLGSDKAIARFSREAMAAAACEHPNVCTIFEVDDSDEGTFIAMAFVEGRSLKEQLAAGPLDFDEAVDVATQVAQGLRAAHTRGIIHRDIKPSNLMITPSGLVKIMDFGLARPPEADEITATGSAVGTVAYMSPEQARGDDVDERTDIWALGVVLYEMVTGRRPFRGQQPQAVLFSLLNENVDPMTSVPQQLDWIIRRAMAKPVGRRYQNVDEVLADLRSLELSTADFTTRLLRPSEKVSALTNLPLQLTSFVGREEEVTEVRRLVSDNRLLTLTGAGGSGKTRLAQEVGTSLLEGFPDGVWLVELAPLREAALVPQAVVTALGLMEASSRMPTEALVGYLQRRNLLLVLDNCEHLVEACAELADGILHVCPDVRLLATSREPLAITGETIFHVPSLAVPGVEDQLPLAELAEVAAVRLFIERAAAAETGFALTTENARAVVEISRRLDGIPLALELAAARIKVLPPGEIARRLKDRFDLLSSGSRTSPPRHRTLTALIDWSYELLSETEQTLFRRLSVFAGGWALDSAEAVCIGEGIDGADVLRLMSSLVEKSLVEKHAGPEGASPRYRMHETIREYARDHLSDQERARLSGKHSDHFLELAERAGPHLHGGAEQIAWLRRLRDEHENIRAAIDACTPGGDGTLFGLRLAVALREYWNLGGHWNEGRKILTELLARPEAQSRTVLRARALRCACLLAMLQMDNKGIHELLEESLEISRDLEDRSGTAASLLLLGRIASRQVGSDEARRMYQESLEISRELGHKGLIAECLSNLANTDADPDRQRELFLESLELHRDVQDRAGEARVLGNLGWLAFNKAEYDEAQLLMEEGLATYRELGDPNGVSWTLLLLASVAIDQGEPGRARELCEKSLALTRRLGSRLWESFGLSTMGRALRLEGDLEQARLLLEESLAIVGDTSTWLGALVSLELGLACVAVGEHGRARTLLGDSWSHGIPRAIAARLEGLGILSVATGASARAARLFGAADALRERESCPVPPVDRLGVDRGISAARRELGARAFEEEWDSGRLMPTEQAIDYARSTHDEREEEDSF